MVSKFNPRYHYFSRKAISSLYTEVREDLVSTCYLFLCHYWYVDIRVNYHLSFWCSHGRKYQTITTGYTQWMEPRSLSFGSNNHWFWLKHKTGLFITTVDENHCFGHNLDLVIQKSLQDDRVQRVLKVCHQIVANFSQSWKKSRWSIVSTKVADERWLPNMMGSSLQMIRAAGSNQCCVGQWH